MLRKTPEITLSQSALDRVKEIRQKSQNQGKFLRIGVSSGGCSGFQYLFNLDDKINESEDLLIKEEGDALIAITDETSLQFLQGCEIDFVKDLGASYFKVKNPNASASCGCGSSFAV
jgi:iron-sulfur cluster assembly accessory protein